MRRVIRAVLLLALVAVPTGFVSASEEDAIRGKNASMAECF